MKIISTIHNFRSWRKGIIGSVGFVPTMGALHDGHLSLIARSVADNDRTCVTIFVNPRQFGLGEDFMDYPRDHQADTQALENCKVDLLFAPGVEEMYPTGSVTSVSVIGIGDILEGEFRPDFFKGVATVVTKLLFQVLPDRVYFGEKDYQQLQIIRWLVKDLNIDVEVVVCPTVRDPDGLALSSRNVRLTKKERESALLINEALSDALNEWEKGQSGSSVLKKIVEQKISLNPLNKLEYISLANEKDFIEQDEDAPGSIVSVAVVVGKTRLIDNVVLK